MKTFTLTIILSFIGSFAFAAQDSLLNKQLDSVQYALLKPRLESYIAKAEELSEKIKSTSDKKAIRLYSKQLGKMTDSMLVTANAIYDYRKISQYGQTMVILPNGTLAYAYTLQPNLITGKCPPVNETLDKLYSASSTIFVFPGIKQAKAEKIDELLNDLRKY